MFSPVAVLEQTENDKNDNLCKTHICLDIASALIRLCVIMVIIIPNVNFQQSDWSNGRVTILNVTRQCLTVVKYVLEMGHSVQ